MSASQKTLLEEVHSISNEQIVADSQKRLDRIEKLIEQEETSSWPFNDPTIQPPDLMGYRNHAEEIHKFQRSAMIEQNAQEVIDATHRYAETNSVVARVVDQTSTFTSEFQTFIEEYLNTPNRKQKKFVTNHPEYGQVVPLDKTLQNQSKYFVQKKEEGFGFKKTPLGKHASMASTLMENTGLVGVVLSGVYAVTELAASYGQGYTLNEFLWEIKEEGIGMVASAYVTRLGESLGHKTASDPLDFVIYQSMDLQETYDESKDALASHLKK